MEVFGKERIVGLSRGEKLPIEIGYGENSAR
jgi:hypothetical protein